MKLDKQQKLAVDHPEKTMAISAGAGSGKTRVLVERYIKVVLDGIAEIDEILAITFTKKAASELKSRVRERLQEVSESGDKEKKMIAERALRKIDSAPISTFHSFCQSMLKENTIEAGLEHYSLCYVEGWAERVPDIYCRRRRCGERQPSPR